MPPESRTETLLQSQSSRMKGEASPSTPKPLQILGPGDDEESLRKGKMAIVTHTAPATFSPFTVPDDWFVEERSRTSGFSAGVVDGYYYEPVTGQQFQSLKAVEKYLMKANENTPTPKPSKSMMLRWAEKELHHKGETAIVARTTTSHFKVPDDWIVREKRRSSGYSVGRTDKYYYEPATGRQFRSLRSVERYLAEAKENTSRPKMLMLESKELHYGTEMAIVAPKTITRTSPFKLPDDWVVQEKPRASGLIDKYYYEPGTGQKFRSLISVQRYLTEARENKPTPKELKPGNHIMPSQNSGSPKENIFSYKAKTAPYDFANPPVKVKWVLTGAGDAWSPFMGDSMVADSAKQQWAKAFILSVNYENFSAPSSQAFDS